MQNQKIGLFINGRDEVKALAEEIIGVLHEKGKVAYLLREQAEELNLTSQDYLLSEVDFLAQIELLVVIGGDGTFLKAAELVHKVGIPLLGINKGRLGFLSELEAKDFSQALDCLLVGSYELEARMMIHAALYRDNKCIAEGVGLNDITLNRDPIEVTLSCETYLAKEKIAAYLGDGLIVATPTGSTGYSLSVGGPLIYPGTDCFIITPIAPHSLGTRPVIVPAESEINVYLHEMTQKAYLFCDGRLVFELKGRDRISLSRAKEAINLVHLRPHRFFETVSTKLLSH